MELWLRSQDKSCLMLVNKVAYDYVEGLHMIVVNEYPTMFGIYETEERALEVLAEISSKIKNQFIVTVSGLWRPEDVKLMKNQLEKDYAGDFIMETQPLDIKPLNQNVIYYELPEK